MKAIKILSVLLIVSLLSGCCKDDSVDESVVLSSEKQITSFQFLLSDNHLDFNLIGAKDGVNKTKK